MVSRMINFHAKEKSEFNQYWYSSGTVTAIINELKHLNVRRCAFLSTPSVFHEGLKAGIKGDLFDFDPQLFNDNNGLPDSKCYVFDYTAPLIPARLYHQYDCVVVDPPFVSAEVMAAYAATARSLLKTCGRIMITSIAENLELLIDRFDPAMRAVTFQPCIPSLVYQYNLFVNYEPDAGSDFARMNPELNQQATSENS